MFLDFSMVTYAMWLRLAFAAVTLAPVASVLYVSSSAGYCANTNPYRGFTRGFFASGTATDPSLQAAIDGFTAFNSRTSPFSPGAFPGATHSYRGLAFGGNLDDSRNLRFGAADAATARCIDFYGPACGPDSYGIIGLKFEAALPLTWQASSITSKVTALNDCPPTVPATAGSYAVAWTKTDGTSFKSSWATLPWNMTQSFSVGGINPYMHTFYLFAAPSSTASSACTRLVLSLDVSATTIPVQACSTPTPMPSATAARTPTAASTPTRSRTGTRTASRTASTGSSASSSPTATATMPATGGGGGGASATASETPSSSSTASGTASGSAAATASLTTGVSASLTATMTASATASGSVPASARPSETWMLGAAIIDAVDGVGGSSGGGAGGAAPGAGGDGGGDGSSSKGGLSGRSIGIIVASVLCGLVIAGVLLFLLRRRWRSSGRRRNGALQLRDPKHQLPPLTMELRPGSGPGTGAGKAQSPLEAVPSKAGPGAAGRRSAMGEACTGAVAPDLAAALQTFARPTWRRQSRVSGVSAPSSDAAAKALQGGGDLGLRLASLPMRPRALDDAAAKATPAGVAAKALGHKDAAARPKAASGTAGKK